MSSRTNDSDSPTLATLRRYYKDRRPFGFSQATAYRLGRYAVQRNMPIYDYGAHSRHGSTSSKRVRPTRHTSVTPGFGSTNLTFS
jgi:hypothetical protein